MVTAEGSHVAYSGFKYQAFISHARSRLLIKCYYVPWITCVPGITCTRLPDYSSSVNKRTLNICFTEIHGQMFE